MGGNAHTTIIEVVLNLAPRNISWMMMLSAVLCVGLAAIFKSLLQLLGQRTYVVGASEHSWLDAGE
jgi:hypothetical protein